jgi:hypothetical protein
MDLCDDPASDYSRVMREISRYLFLTGALPFLVLGVMHAAFTPHGTAEAKPMSPRDAAFRDAMTRETVRLTRRVTLWQGWVGFNLSHSLGVILLGAVVVLIGRSAASFAAEAAVFLPLAVLVAATYLAIGALYWFKTPVVWIAVSGACFLLSWVLFVTSA